MTMRIYTKTGDQGQTSLLGGTRVSKHHARIEAYGTLDELNSYLGLLADLCPEQSLKAVLKTVQDRLFTMGSSLACDPDKETKMVLPDLLASDIKELENEIDRMSEELAPLKQFILPGGHPTVSTCHIVRCVCRRAERFCTALQDEKSFVAPLVIPYLNRLSDYLFVLARYLGHLLKVPEIPWIPRS